MVITLMKVIMYMIKNGIYFLLRARFVFVGSLSISDFPDHATFREAGVNTGVVEQTLGFLLFDPMLFGQL